MTEAEISFGSIFNRSTFSSGFGTIKDWVAEVKAKNLSAINFSEHNSLASFIILYEMCLKEKIKTFPSLSMSFCFSFEQRSKYQFQNVILCARNEQGYYDLVNIKNVAERQYKDKSSYFCSELAESDLSRNAIEQNNIDVFFPLTDIFIGEKLELFFYLYNAMELNDTTYFSSIEEAEKKIDFVYEMILIDMYQLSKYSNQDENGVLRFTAPITTSRNIQARINGLILFNKYRSLKFYENEGEEPIVSFHTPEIKLYLNSHASYPSEKIEEVARSYQDISIGFKIDYVRDAYIRTTEDYMKLCAKPLRDFPKDSRIRKIISDGYKEGFFNSVEYISGIDFSMKLYNFRLPHLYFEENGVEVSCKDYFNKLIVESWNYFADLDKNGQYKIAYWGEENQNHVSSIEEIFSIDSKRAQRLKYEYGVIDSLGFIEYFLIVWDIINYCDQNKLRRNPCGRGSVGGSLVAYLLKITGVDPIDSPYWSDLLFERFLNEERVRETKSLPDIDLDFSPETREKVIEYIGNKYGQDKVCFIGTFQRLKLNSVIKDLARQYDYMIPTNSHPENYSRIIKKHCIEYTLNDINDVLTDKEFRKIKKDQSAEEVIKEALETSEVFSKFYEAHSNWFEKHVIPICKNNRSLGIHAAGVLILPENIDRCLPYRIDGKGKKISEYEMGECEKVGFVKLDLLGLKSAGMVDYAAQLVSERSKKLGGDESYYIPEFSEIPLDDHSVFSEIRRDPYGVFQFKSPLQRQYQSVLNPDHLSQLVASVALLRTGPMKAGAHDTFLSIKKGIIEPSYEHETMIPALKETGGIIIYQEQIMQLVGNMAGFTLVQADNLRRAIGKKKPEILAQQKDLFADGCRKNNIPDEVIDKVWQKIDYFSGYGFNQCVTGENMITLPFNWSKNEFCESEEEIKDDEFKMFQKHSKSFVKIPIAYVYFARYSHHFMNSFFRASDMGAAIVDTKHFENKLFEYLENHPENEKEFFDIYEKTVLSPSEFRNTSTFVESPEYRKLLEINRNKTFGSILGYADGVGIFHNVVDIIRLEKRQPIFHIATASGQSLRGGPSHKVMVYKPNTSEIVEKMLAELTMDDLLIISATNNEHAFLTSHAKTKVGSYIKSQYDKISQHERQELKNVFDDKPLVFMDLRSIAKYKIPQAFVDESLEDEIYEELTGVSGSSKHEVFSKVTDVKKIDRGTFPLPIDYSQPSKSHPITNYGIPCYFDRIVSKDLETSDDVIYEVEMVPTEHPHSHLYFSNNILSHNSHAVSYSAFGYYMAWIKTYYPAEYWCGVLKYAPHSRKMSNNIYEIKDHLEHIGIEVRFPRLESFHWSYSPVFINNTSEFYITWPLSSVKDIGLKVSKRIFRRSKDSGGFKNISEFFKRCGAIGNRPNLIDLRVFKALLYCGFFDNIIQKSEKISASEAKIISREVAIDVFFESTKRTGKNNEITRNQLKQNCSSASLFFEQQINYCKSIPSPVRKIFSTEYSVMTKRQYEESTAGSPVSLMGIITSARNFKDKNGNRMSICTISDYRMTAKIVIFKDMYAAIKESRDSKVPAVGHVIQVIGEKQVDRYGTSIILGSSQDSYYKLLGEFDEKIFK